MKGSPTLSRNGLYTEDICNVCHGHFPILHCSILGMDKHMYKYRFSMFFYIKYFVVVYTLPSPIFPLVVHQPASPSIWPAVQSLRRGPSTNPRVTMWCVCGCSWRDDVCRVCECSRGGLVVMDVSWRRLCVCMIWGRVIYLFWVGQGCDEWGWEVSLQSC